MFGNDITKERNFSFLSIWNSMLRTAHKYIRLKSIAHELMNRVLCRLGFEFSAGWEIWKECEMNEGTVSASKLPFELTNRLNIRKSLDIADGSANFCDNNIVLRVELFHTCRNLIGDMWDNLHGFSVKHILTFFFNHGFIYFSCGDRVFLRDRSSKKAFVISQIQIRTSAVCGDKALSVFERVHIGSVDIDIGITFLNRDGVSSRLE